MIPLLAQAAPDVNDWVRAVQVLGIPAVMLLGYVLLTWKGVLPSPSEVKTLKELVVAMRVESAERERSRNEERQAAIERVDRLAHQNELVIPQVERMVAAMTEARQVVDISASLQRDSMVRLDRLEGTMQRVSDAVTTMSASVQVMASASVGRG